MDGRFQFNPPRGLIPKATIVRVMVASEGYDPLYLTHTYFVFPEERDKHAFPVISSVGEEDRFFGDRNGIYVPVNNYREGRYITGIYYQRARHWEQEISLE